ncbi:MAG TPA: HAMP domain-containing sensor histidine kinase [Gallionella sp.]|nr:HAMP domain-containing sensor histidine kinase [Gallionella sp.]
MTLADRFYAWTGSDISAENLPIRAGQLRERLNNYPIMIVSQLLVAALLCVLMWDVVSHRVLLGWLAALYAAHTVEVWHWWRYRDRLQSLEECKAWRARFILLVSMVGAIWGSAGILMFVPGDLAYQTLLICIVLGIAAGAVTLNPVFPPSLYIFVGLLILPFIFTNLVIGDRVHSILAVMLTIYLVFVLNAGRGLSRTFEQSLRGEWENARLVGELVQQKERAEQAHQDAELASRMKSQFFAAANHDLRQPMHALAMYVEVLKNSALGEQTKATVMQLDRSVEVMCAMFDTLLDISRLDAGVVQASCEPFALGPLLDKLRGEFGMLARNKGLWLEMGFCFDKVCSDPLLLERILRNLLSNAIRYTERGGVTVTCRMMDEGARIEVRDTGIGISPEHLPHIFEEYYQVSNRQRDRSKGLGLGLAIVERLARLLGFRMQVRSTLGEGTCFSFVIPACEPGVMIADKPAA